MKSRLKLTAFIETVLVAVIFWFIIKPHWNNDKVTTGDFFSMEVAGMLAYNAYENIKKFL